MRACTSTHSNNVGARSATAVRFRNKGLRIEKEVGVNSERHTLPVLVLVSVSSAIQCAFVRHSSIKLIMKARWIVRLCVSLQLGARRCGNSKNRFRS